MKDIEKLIAGQKTVHFTKCECMARATVNRGPNNHKCLGRSYNKYTHLKMHKQYTCLICYQGFSDICGISLNYLGQNYFDVCNVGLNVGSLRGAVIAEDTLAGKISNLQQAMQGNLRAESVEDETLKELRLQFVSVDMNF
jgi:hypothetical protein